MIEWPWRSRSPKEIFQGLIYTLTWFNGFCGETGKRGGMVGKGIDPRLRNAVLIFFNEIFLGGLYIQLFPLGQVHKAYILSSMWRNESWEARPPSMCLDHIIAHETYHFYLALPLKPTSTCFTKQCGTSRTQEFEYTWWSGLQTMLNVQHKVHVTCKLHWTCTN